MVGLISTYIPPELDAVTKNSFRFVNPSASGATAVLNSTHVSVELITFEEYTNARNPDDDDTYSARVYNSDVVG